MRDEESALLEAAGAAERSGDYSGAFDAWQHLASMTSLPTLLQGGTYSPEAGKMD